MANGKPITNDRLYDALNDMRLELKQDIGDLRRQFETLEAGRLTRAEGHIQDLRIELLDTASKLKTNQAVISTKVLVIWAIGSALFSLAGAAIVMRLMHQ